MYKYIYPLIKWKIKPWLKYYIVKKGEGTPSEIITSASPITLVNSLRKKFIKFIVGGNSIQDGEPSPETQVPIKNVIGDVEVKVENKNLAINNEISNLIEYANTIYPNAAGEKKKWIDNIINLPKDVNLIGNWDFTGDGKAVGGTSGERVTIYYTDNTSQITTKGIKFIIPSGKTISYILIYGNQNATTAKWSNIQFEEGSATDYVPHEEQTAIFPLEEGQVLHEGDTIGDKIVQRRKTVIFDGSNDEGWYLQNNTFRCPLANAKYNGKVLSNYFIDRNVDNTGDYIWIFLDGYVLVKFPSISTVEEFTTWLSTHNLTVEYELVEPIETEFTEAQRTAKAEIDKLISYKGTTHISSTNEPSPIFEVQYYMEGE